MSELFSFEGEGAARLQARRWLEVERPKAAVQIAHGMAEHGGRYARFAEVLNAFGYIVYAADHRGHGLNISDSTPAGHLGDEAGWRAAVGDLYCLNREIAARHAGVPIFLFGHSMGSFMAQDYIARHGDSIEGVILSGSNGPQAGLQKLKARMGLAFVRRAVKKFGPRAHHPQLRGIFKGFNRPFAPNRTDFDWLSRDEGEVDKYIADPLCGFDCSLATWEGVMDALLRIAAPAALRAMKSDLPIHVFSGSEDPVGEAARGVRRLLDAYAAHGFTRVSHKFYPGGRHEMLNETNRDEVMADIVVWINGVIG